MPLARKLDFARRWTAKGSEEVFSLFPPHPPGRHRVRIIRPEQLPSEYLQKLEDIMTAEHEAAPLPFNVPGTRIETEHD